MKRFMNLLMVVMVSLLFMACGIDVPVNDKVKYNDRDYSSLLHVENFYIQSTGDKIYNENTATRDDVANVIKVFQTDYDNLSIGDVIGWLDRVYGTHTTHITYYGNDMRYSKHLSISFMWGDEDVNIIVPASYEDDTNKIKPLQVSKLIMMNASKIAKETNMSKEAMMDEIKGQFFIPTILYKNTDDVVQYVDFKRIPEIIAEIKEAKADEEVASRSSYDVVKEDPLNRFQIDAYGVVYTGDFKKDIDNYPGDSYWYVEYYIGDNKVTNCKSKLSVNQIIAKAERNLGVHASRTVYVDMNDNIVVESQVYNDKTEITAILKFKIVEYIGAQGSTLEATDLTLETFEGEFSNDEAIAKLKNKLRVV